MVALGGFRRTTGGVGARNHVLVLPSVVCATHVARELEGDGVIVITHQHGCLHVGDDLHQTENAFVGVATSANIGAVVVVSLGCETLQGRKLASRLAENGQSVLLVGIQSAGGTWRAVEQGREALEEIQKEIRTSRREPAQLSELVVGLDGDGPLAQAIQSCARERGVRVVRSADRRGAAGHVELAGKGAQVIVSLRGAGEGPIGFAVCPVIAVAADRCLFAALHEDFDVDGSGGRHDATASVVLEQVTAVFNGRPTASEKRGARDFVLHRLLVTM